jgi:hypothetical protein
MAMWPACAVAEGVLRAAVPVEPVDPDPQAVVAVTNATATAASARRRR